MNLIIIIACEVEVFCFITVPSVFFLIFKFRLLRGEGQRRGLVQ